MCETCVYRQTGEAWELLSNTCRMLPMFAVGKLCLPQLFLDPFCLTAVGVTPILPTTGFRLLSTWSLHYCVCESMLLFLKLPGRDAGSSAITPSFFMSSHSKSFLPRLQVMDLFLSCLFLHWAYLESSRVGLLHLLQFQISSWFFCHISISFLGFLNSSPVSSSSAGTWWPFLTNPLSNLCQTISTVPPQNRCLLAIIFLIQVETVLPLWPTNAFQVCPDILGYCVLRLLFNFLTLQPVTLKCTQVQMGTLKILGG